MRNAIIPSVAAAVIAATALGAAPPAMADAPVAIIEDINAPSSGKQLMEYLEQGESLVLNHGESITISYFDSCSVERIEGGRIKIGFQKSQVSGGKVETENVPCGGGGIVLTESQSDQSAGIVFRGSLDFADKDAVTIYSVSPLFVLTEPQGELVIMRSDRSTRPHVLEVTGNRLDTADLGIKLSKGVEYTATNGENSIKFTVSDDAADSTRSVISRLIGL